jgi:hypothetical protein
MDEPNWWSMLRALDEPVAPPDWSTLQLSLRSVLADPMPESVLSALNEQRARRARGGCDLEVPRDFDLAATQRRFDLLAERVSEAYGCPCDQGLMQDSAGFGSIGIPAEASRSRTKRTRIPLPLLVSVSKFGGLATYGPPSTPSGQVPYVHPDDRQRIEDALAELGYLLVPEHILATPYDGPNGWAFDQASATWFTRFFDYI